MSIAAEFKEFAMKGNVVDLAVGVIIGAAFGKIVASFVSDIIMPPLGLLLGGANFSDLAITLGVDPKGVPVLLKYGAFVQTVVDFLIVAVVIFIAIRAINKMQRPQAAAVAAPPRQEVLLEQIREALIRQSAKA